MDKISKVILLICAIIALIFAYLWVRADSVTYEPKVTLLASVIAVLSFLFQVYGNDEEKKASVKIENKKNNSIVGDNNNIVIKGNNNFLLEKVKELRLAYQQINQLTLPDVTLMGTNPQKFLNDYTTLIPIAYIKTVEIFDSIKILLKKHVALEIEREHVNIELMLTNFRAQGVNNKSEGIHDIVIEIGQRELLWIQKILKEVEFQLNEDTKKLNND